MQSFALEVPEVNSAVVKKGVDWRRRIPAGEVHLMNWIDVHEAPPASARMRRGRRRLNCLSVLMRATATVAVVNSAVALAQDKRYEYASFGSNFNTTDLSILNWQSPNGHFEMMSTDTHRSDLAATGNTQAEFFNWFENAYESQQPGQKDGNAGADIIDEYVVKESQTTGPKPNWIYLNEISFSQWPVSSDYRTWVINCVTRLRDFYHYNVVTYSPFFTNPTTGFNSSWQALVSTGGPYKSFIGVESYISGQSVKNNGFNVTTTQNTYQSGINAYLSRTTVTAPGLFMSEHMGTSVSGEFFGSGGLNDADWIQAIIVRQQALHNISVAGTTNTYSGFNAYSWGSVESGATAPTASERNSYEYAYRSQQTMWTEGSQWVGESNATQTFSTTSWNGTNPTLMEGSTVVIDWMGGVPNSAGAVANFYKNLTTNQTVTLDGSKTVGTINFNSNFSFLITPGSGGTLTLDNSGNTASVNLVQGNHSITAPVQLTSNSNFAVPTASVLTLGGAVSGTGTLSMSGGGTLLVTSAASSYSGNTVANGGLIQFTSNSSFGNTNSIVANGGGAVGALSSSLDPTFLGKIIAAASPSTGGLALTSANANTAIDFTSGTLSNPNLVGMSIGALGSITFNGSLTPDPTRGYRLGGGGTLTMPAGSVSGTNNVTIANGGVVVFAGSNNYTGTTQINNSGTLRISNDNALGNAGNSIAFDNGSLQLGASFIPSAGRAIVLNAGGGTIDTNGFATTLGQNISGSGDLGKVGAGTLVLSGTNSFTGGVNINGGVLNVATAAALGNGGPIGINGGTLQLAGNFSLGASQGVTLGAGNASIDSNIFTATLAGAFGGSGGLTKLGSGTVLIGAGSTYDGTTTISAGTLKANDVNAFSPNSDVAIGASSTMDLNGFAQTIGQLSGTGAITLSGPLTTGIDNVATTYTGKITGTGSLIKTGTGSMLLTVSNAYTGGTIINQGILSMSNSNALGTIPTSPATNLTINNGATLRFSAASMTLGSTRQIVLGAGGGTIDTQSNTGTVAGTISGSGALYKFGTGTLSLSASNSYSGGTLISGRLNVDVSSTDPLGSGQITMRGGMGPTSNLIAELGIGVAGISATLSNPIVLTPGQTPGSNSNAIGFGGLGTDSFEVVTGSTLTLNGIISGIGPVYKGIVAGTAGTVVFGGANTYTDDTLIQTGTLRLGANGVIPDTSQVNVSAGATFDVNGKTETIGSLFNSGPVLLGNGSLSTGIDGTSTLYSGNISGAGGSLAKQGAGTFQLSGVNTYTGQTAVQTGIVQMLSNTAVPTLSQVNVSSGATLDINGFTASVGSLVGAGRVTLGTTTGSLTIGNDNATASFSGVIAGTGPLTKVGTGTQTLSNSGDTYTGITTINGGVLAITAETAIGPAPTSLRANAITLNGGTYRDVSASAFTIPVNRGITVNAAGGTLDFSSSAGVPTLASQITGSGTLTKMGIKTLVVNTNNAGSFSGNWIIRQGRLNAQNAAVNSLGTGSISLSPGNGDVAQLGVGGGPGITAELANSIILSPTGNGQNSIEVANGNTLTLDGAISGSGGLQKSGGSASGTQGGSALVTAGTLILRGNNTYSGPTTVNDGLLQLSPNGAWEEIPDGSDVTLAKTTATLDLNNHNETIGSLSGNGPVTLGSATLTTGQSGASTTHSGTISGNGALTKTGAGLFALSGSNTYTGGTNINAGTLQISEDNNLGDASGPINFNGGTLQAVGGFVSTARNIAVNAGGGTIDNASDLTVTGSVAGAGTLSKTSAGTLHVASFNLGGLSINGGTVHVLPSGLAPSSTSILASAPAIDASSQLDVEDNGLIITYPAGDTTHAARDAIRNLLANGRNAGPANAAPWNGNGGITSTYAHNVGNGFNLAIGYADNTDLAAVRASGSYTTFGGQTVASNTVLIQLTRGADATMDGVVDGQDVAIIGTHFQKPGSGQWCFGDFDYSGTCDGSDVSVLGTTFGKTSPVLSPAQMTAEFGSAFTAAFEAGQNGAVPEPNVLALVGLGGIALMAPRRRKRRAGVA